MPTRAKVAGAAYIALAAADTVLAARPEKSARAARFVTKPLLMPVLSTGFVAATGGRGRLAQGTSAAHAFSWGGDVALLGRSNQTFLAGLSSFLAAHLAYVFGFLSRRDKIVPLTSSGVKAAAAMAAVTAPVMAVAAGRKNPRLRTPVAAYGAALASTLATSTLLDRRMPRRARRRIVAGTTLFVASDVALGVREFLLPSGHRALDAAVMATYTAGQGLVAAGVAEAVRAER